MAMAWDWTEGLPTLGSRLGRVALACGVALLLAGPRSPSAAVAGTGAQAPAGGLFQALGAASGGITSPTGEVMSLVALGGDLYMGGFFAEAGGATVNNIVRYNRATDAFSPLGATSGTPGVDGIVMALAVVNGQLYLGGNFRRAGGASAHNLARYNPATDTFAPLGLAGGQPGVDDRVQALTGLNGELFVGGWFRQAGGVPAASLARYSPVTDRFAAVGTGLRFGPDGDPAPVLSLASLAGQLYVGGRFTHAGGVAADSIVRYDPASQRFAALGSGASQISGPVTALAVIGQDLFLGGYLTSPDQQINLAARYSPADNRFSPLFTRQQDLNAPVVCLAAAGDDLYLGGAFEQMGDQTINRVVRMDTSTRPPQASPLGSHPVGVDGYVAALASVDGDLYLGGSFTSAGGVPANAIVRYTPAPRAS